MTRVSAPTRAAKGPPVGWRPEGDLCVAGLLPTPSRPSPQLFFLRVHCFVFITQQEPWGV